MIKAKEVVGVSGGIGIGAVDTFLLRKYVDPKYGVKKLKRFGQASVLVNLATGIPSLVLGIAGMLGKGPLKRNDLLKWSMSAYGTTATTGAVLGLVFPVEGAYATTVAAKQAAVLGRVELGVPSVTAPAAAVEVPAAVPTVPEQFM